MVVWEIPCESRTPPGIVFGPGRFLPAGAFFQSNDACSQETRNVWCLVQGAVFPDAKPVVDCAFDLDWGAPTKTTTLIDHWHPAKRGSAVEPLPRVARPLPKIPQSEAVRQCPPAQDADMKPENKTGWMRAKAEIARGRTQMLVAMIAIAVGALIAVTGILGALILTESKPLLVVNVLPPIGSPAATARPDSVSAPLPARPDYGR